MKTEFYRVKLENGNIGISLFDRGNPIPFYRYNGKLNKEVTINAIKDIIFKISNKDLIYFLEAIINNKEA